MSGSAIADAAGTGKMMQNMMTTRRHAIRRAFAAALTAVTAVIGPIIPPSIPMVLYALDLGRLDRLPVPRRRRPRAADGAGADGAGGRQRQAAQLPGRAADAVARAPARSRRGASRADDAGGAAGRHLQRRHDPDRGGGGRGGLRPAHLGLLYRSIDAARHSTPRCSPARARAPRSAC